ncbi:MAG TPA: M20/M25/M40 family metallo-hydrolase [Symbiobacteriaceae bacterium]|nr:M20/M25/M40 family metallo-hydrolase [Symbiobacteriaceae bacterium]
MAYTKGFVNQERITALLMDLCATDSGSRNERLMADKLKPMLMELGFAVREDDAGSKVGGNAGNLYGRLEGTAPGEPLLFSAHMDRVTPGLGVKPRLEGGAIVSDGTTILGSDDAAGIAAVLEAVRVLKERNLPYPTIEVGFTIGEEVGLLGARYLDYAWFSSKLGFALDSGGKVGEIVVKAPSQAKVNVTFRGKAAHAGVAPEKGVSAIQIAAVAISRMKLLRIDSETTANIGSISTDGPTNIVPETCKIVAEARSLNQEKLEAQVADMQRCAEEAARELGGATEVEILRSYSAFNLSPESAPVRRAAAAAVQIGAPVSITSTGGGSDANIFNGNGIPTAVLGVGYEEIHSTRERMPIDQLVALAEWTLAIIAG